MSDPVYITNTNGDTNDISFNYKIALFAIECGIVFGLIFLLSLCTCIPILKTYLSKPKKDDNKLNEKRIPTNMFTLISYDEIVANGKTSLINMLSAQYKKKHEEYVTESKKEDGDIENNTKFYLLYKFNDMDTSNSMMSNNKKSDPYDDINNFVDFVMMTCDHTHVEILLHISSGGGYAWKFEEIYSKIKSLKEKGYIITALIDNICASGGYMMACACNKIYASELAKIGSIGVISTGLNYYELAEKMGITHKTFTTGAYKDPYPSGEKITEENEQKMNALMEDTFKEFKNLVSESRNLTDIELEDVCSAKVWYGNEALQRKLIDETFISSTSFIDTLAINSEIYFVMPKQHKQNLGMLGNLLQIESAFNKFNKISSLGDFSKKIENITL